MMTEAERQDSAEVSVFVLGSVLVRNRWRVARWMFVGAVVAALSVISKPPLYLSSASFVPRGSDPGRSGLASLAGQFGVSMSSGDQTASPEFYSKLLGSRALLLPIVRDTLVVQEMSERRISFLDLFNVQGESARQREEQGVKLLRGMMRVNIVRMTGIVEFSVTSAWRSVSPTLAAAILNGVSDYNQRTRQGQAAAEREFVQGRLAVAGADLRQAENRLESFLRTNREFSSSPQLSFEHDRIQRDVTLRQQVFTSLTQAYEDARIREVRDTPVITVFESPSIPTAPEPRGRLRRVLTGFMLGGVLGALAVLLSGALAGGRTEDNAPAREFVGALEEARAELLKPARWLRERRRSRA